MKESVLEMMESAKAVAMAKAGYHTLAIARACGMTEGQVMYRLAAGNAIGARRAYRDGASPESAVVLDLVMTWVARQHKELETLVRARYAARLRQERKRK